MARLKVPTGHTKVNIKFGWHYSCGQHFSINQHNEGKFRGVITLVRADTWGLRPIHGDLGSINWAIHEKPCDNIYICIYTKAKQPESGDLCDNITEFGVAEGSPEPSE